MSEPALQLLEHRRPPAPPAAETESPATSPVQPDDVCFVINTTAGGARPALIWPARPVAGGRIAELWERKEFVRQCQPLAKRCLEGEAQHFEIHFEFPPAGTHWFEINLYPGRTAGLPQVIVVIRDVTQRKQTESHLQFLVESVHLLSVSPDLATATTAILKRFCAVSGWPLGEVWVPTPDGALELFSTAAADCPRALKFQGDTAGLTLRVGEGLPAQLWKGAPVYIPELAVDSAFFRAKAAGRAGFHSAFVLPLKSDDQTLALMFFFLTENQPPQAHWIALARAMATELGDVYHHERMQEQLDSFFNRSLDMHCLAGFDGYLKRVNPAWTRTLGYEKDELLTRPLIELVHADDRPLFLENLAKLGQGEDLNAVEVRCLCKDGSARWTLWSATPLPSQHLVIATSRDITGRKHTEAAVQQSEEHYRDLFHQAYQMQENLRRMSDRLLKIQEHERSRISRDLHDEVGQALTAINMNLAILRNTLVASAPEVERRISDTQGLIEQTMDTIHNFSRELRPAMLDDLGLLPALRNYTKTFIERTGILVQLNVTAAETTERLDSDRKTVIYRIVQEGLNNIAKHAGAKRVDILIRGSPQDVHLEVSDDGCGFTLGARPESAPKQLGLLGLAERARLVGGDFAVASLPDRGTILRATIPFKSL